MDWILSVGCCMFLFWYAGVLTVGYLMHDYWQAPDSWQKWLSNTPNKEHLLKQLRLKVCSDGKQSKKKMLLTWIQLLDYLCSLCLFSPHSQCTNCTDISNRLCVLLVCFLLLPLVSNTKFIKPQANIFNWQQHIHSPYWADSPLSTPTGVFLFTFYAIAQHLQLCSVWTHPEKITLLMSSGLWFGLEDKKNYITENQW